MLDPECSTNEQMVLVDIFEDGLEDGETVTVHRQEQMTEGQLQADFGTDYEAQVYPPDQVQQWHNCGGKQYLQDVTAGSITIKHGKRGNPQETVLGRNSVALFRDQNASGHIGVPHPKFGWRTACRVRAAE